MHYQISILNFDDKYVHAYDLVKQEITNLKRRKIFFGIKSCLYIYKKLI